MSPPRTPLEDLAEGLCEIDVDMYEDTTSEGTQQEIVCHLRRIGHELELLRAEARADREAAQATRIATLEAIESVELEAHRVAGALRRIEEPLREWRDMNRQRAALERLAHPEKATEETGT